MNDEQIAQASMLEQIDLEHTEALRLAGTDQYRIDLAEQRYAALVAQVSGEEPAL